MHIKTDSSSLNPLHSEHDLSSHNAGEDKDNNVTRSESSSNDTLRMWLMFAVNVTVVGVVNGLYIYSTLQPHLAVYLTWIQYCGE